MKTKTINNENKASFKNALNYSITKKDSEGQNVVIQIRLSDPCHNGHNDFSITGSVYEKGKPHTDRYNTRGGAIGDYIAEQFPEFAIFNRLHLCDANGVPMYAIANGFYHLTTGFNDKSKDLKTKFCEYYRVTPEQFDVLATAKDQDYYGYLLIKLNILDQWKAEANEAIKLLELLTGDKFKDDSVKSNFDALTPERVAEIEEQINAGYYSTENIAQRETAKQEAAKKKLLQDAENEYKGKELQARANWEMDKILIPMFGTTSNVIMYDHTKQISFNWQDSPYQKTYTVAEMEQFAVEAKRNEFLKDYTCTIK